MSEQLKKPSPFGLVGVILGFVALGVALAHFWLGPIEPAPALEDLVADKAVKIKKAVEARLRGEVLDRNTVSASFDKDELIRATTIGAAFIAIVFAVVSFIKREDLRVSGSAIGLASGAIAFEFAALALGVIVAAILIGVVLSVIGISP